jgi:hypothetical protein
MKHNNDVLELTPTQAFYLQPIILRNHVLPVGILKISDQQS